MKFPAASCRLSLLSARNTFCHHQYRAVALGSTHHRSWGASGTGSDTRQTTRRGGMRVDGLPQGSPSGFIQKTKNKRHFCLQRHHEFKELMLTRLASLKPLTRMPLGHTSLRSLSLALESMSVFYCCYGPTVCGWRERSTPLEYPCC